MSQLSRQSVGVVLTLAGHQDTAVTAHDAKTDSATISVRVGRALIYMHDNETVQAFAEAWQELSSDAVRLPRDRRSKTVAPVRGMREPAIVVDAAGAPKWVGRLVQGRGEWGRLSLTIGRIVFDVRDVPAFASTLVAFREAQLLATQTFAGAGAVTMPLRRRAVQNAASALHVPRQDRPIDRVRGPVQPARIRSVQPVQPRLSQEWMQ